MPSASSLETLVLAPELSSLASLSLLAFFLLNGTYLEFYRGVNCSLIYHKHHGLRLDIATLSEVFKKPIGELLSNVYYTHIKVKQIS